MKHYEKTELINYRINRAQKTLEEINVLIENEFWNIVANRIYYASFYAVSALLIKNDIKTKTHSGTRQMFGLHFVKTGVIPSELGKFYSDIFEMRQMVDYDDFMEFTEQEAIESFDVAQKFIVVIKSLL